MAQVDWEGIRHEAEAFEGEINREYYENFGGLKEEFNIAAIYSRHARLFSRETVDAAQAAVRNARDEEIARQARYFRQFALDGYLGEAVKELDEEITGAEAKTKIHFQDREIPYRQVPVVIANSADRDERSQLAALQQKATEAMNASLEKRMSRLHALAGELGYRDYVDLHAQAKGIDLAGLGRTMAAFLTATEPVYHAALTRLFQRTYGRDLAGAERHDLAHLWRASRFDTAFSSERMVSALKETLAELGIDLDSQKNIILDVENRPSKSPRAFCAPVRTPEEVYLVMLPQGGQDDYAALFHESGHAEHFAHCDPADPMEYRWLGDNSVTECFAFTFEHLIAEPGWLARYAGMSSADEFIDFFYVQKLFFVRRYAAKLLYELELHASPSVPEARERYATLLSRATLVRVPGVDYLTDVDDGFYAAQYLRAWILESQLKEALRRRFGCEWFRVKAAGDFLAELWRYGQKYDATEIARMLGFDGLDARPLTNEILQVLSVAR